MAKHGNRRRRQSRWLSDAALQALVRFGPEESGLRAAARDAQATYGTTVRQADATARGLKYAVDRARPKVAANYDRAGLQAARAQSVAAPDLAAAGVPASMRAAVAAEQAGFSSRLGESRAQSLTELDDRRLQAAEGAGYAKSNARNVLATDLSKLFDRAQDVSREKGAFTVATAGELQRAAQQRADTIANQQAGRDVTMRGQDLSHADRVAARKEAAKNGGPGGKKGQTLGGATRDQLGAASDEIGRLRDEIKTFPGASRSEIAAILRKGAKDQTTPLHDPQTGKPLYNKDGTPKVRVRPGVDKAKSQLLLAVALDVQLKGYVSKENHRKLVRRGLALRDLGLPSEGGYRKRQRRQRRRANTPAGKTGQTVGNAVGVLGQILGLG